MIFSITNASRFYKFTRYLFGLNKVIQPDLDAMRLDVVIPPRPDALGGPWRLNPFRQSKAASVILLALNSFRKRQTWLGAWLTGTDKLIRQITDEMRTAEQQLDNGIKSQIKHQQLEELKSLPIIASAAKSTHTTIIKHLMDRFAFIKMAPIPKPKLMNIPHTFESFGKYNNIHARAQTNEGQPANYRNLMDVYKKNQEIIDANRPTLGEYANRCNETLCNQIWQHASDAVDGALAAQGYAQRGIKWLENSAPTMAFDKKEKPLWKPADPQKQDAQEKALYSYRY